MPALDKPLRELQEYRGISPRPGDFDAFWTAALQELDATCPHPKFTLVDVLGNVNAELFDLHFTGVGGARIYAKYLRPKNPPRPGPAVMMFHGYSGASGDWSDKLNFVNEGFAVASLDCRGQGGRSEDNLQAIGNTQEGQLIRGLEGPPEKLLFRQIFLDTAQLARVVLAQPEIDPMRAASWGGSQGGALSVVCAALEPRIRRCVSVYPFLSDYRRVWEMDLAKDAYGALGVYLRRFDPLHQRIDEMFNKLGYIDVQNFAERVKAEVLMAITLMDNICPPSTQYAIFNKLTAKKEAVVYPNHGHEFLPMFNDFGFRFLMPLKD
jgi:cephalosporin-C deacetylase